MDFVPARKEQSYLKMLVTGAPGSGKTWGALRLGSALAMLEGGKMVVIDTEGGASQLYADQYKFDIGIIGGSYHPDQFLDAITSAVKAGYKVMVIDSGTHQWEGILALKDVIEAENTKRGNRNSYAAWKEPKQKHAQFVDFLRRAPIHVIVTSRIKVDYQQVESAKGFMTIQKVGTKVKQNDEFDYEFDMVAEISHGSHDALIAKSRYACIENDSTVSDLADMAQDLHAWLKDGVTPEVASKPDIAFDEATPPPTASDPAALLTGDEVASQVNGAELPRSEIKYVLDNDVAKTVIPILTNGLFEGNENATVSYLESMEKRELFNDGHNPEQVYQLVLMDVAQFKCDTTCEEALSLGDGNLTDWFNTNGGYTVEALLKAKTLLKGELAKDRLQHGIGDEPAKTQPTGTHPLTIQSVSLGTNSFGKDSLSLVTVENTTYFADPDGLDWLGITEEQARKEYVYFDPITVLYNGGSLSKNPRIVGLPEPTS